MPASPQDPRAGPTPDPATRPVALPGTEADLVPRADHGEESYRGAGKLRDRAAIISGGDSGIGRAVAIAFAREGADVTLLYGHPEEEADAADTAAWVERAGRRALRLQLDVRDPDACRTAVEQTLAAFGRLDIVVCNAATQHEVERPEDLRLEDLERTVRTNLYGTIFLVQAALPHLGPGSSILVTGSITGLEGHRTLLDYAATKGALHALTKSLAQALADRGIRVNCVAPGPVWTPLIPATFDAEHLARFGRDTVWGRPAQPAEIAPSYVFLASEDGRYYTGEILAPTGRSTTR